MDDWLHDFENFEFELAHPVEAGERLVLEQWGRNKGKGSGLKTEIHYAAVYTFRKGKVAYCPRVPHLRRRSRSRWPVGVGDVAGERGDCARWNAAYNRRDMKTLFALTASDFEFRSIFLTMESVFRGHEGLDAYFEAIEDAYERFVVLADEFIDAGAAVLVVAHVDWRARRAAPKE